MLNYFPYLFFRDPDMLNELYVTKNKYFDKHPFVKEGLQPLMGDALFLSRGDLKWSQQRKTLGQSFYKDKLMKYLEMIRICTDESISKIRTTYVTTNKSMDLIEET
mmetsp:Transcript_30634/g.30110  ORF Transcript_30634/g.30110 Transcript_30634/m.30110 type:complete len:106 (-) Transcript_30634:1049-1366(-)